jgi:hypothetical protein
VDHMFARVSVDGTNGSGGGGDGGRARTCPASWTCF